MKKSILKVKSSKFAVKIVNVIERSLTTNRYPLTTNQKTIN